MERVESGIVHELRLHDRQTSGHGIGHRREPKFLERVLENLAQSFDPRTSVNISPLFWLLRKATARWDGYG
jgi:hypothetical protein